MMRAPDGEEEAAETQGAGLRSYRLAARSERDVQEVEVLATLSRGELKEALADVLQL